jgi:hypothetical protein
MADSMKVSWAWLAKIWKIGQPTTGDCPWFT